MARILVGVDGDGLVRAVVPVLATLLRPEDDVLLLHAASGDHSAGQDRVESLFDEIGGELEPSGASVRPDFQGGLGSAAATIIETAARQGADLVALGSHGRGRVGAALGGSVSHVVAAALDCRVLIASGGGPRKLTPRPLRRIMLALAAAGDPRPGIEVATEIALQHGAEVTVYHARPLGPTQGSAGSAGRKAANSAVGRARLQLKLDGIAAAALVGVAWRGVAESIAAAADGEDADLIVLDSHRPGDWEAMLAPSTAYALLGVTNRPLLLIERAQRLKVTAGALAASAPA